MGATPDNRIPAAAPDPADAGTAYSARWSHGGIDPKDSGGPYACQRLRRPRFSPVLQARFRIHRDDRLFAIGSCFARGIENALKARGFQVESAARDFDQFRTKHGEPVTALGFTNKYTTHSMLNELSWALDPAAKFPEASLVELDPEHCIDPHINPTLEATDRAGTLERRRIMQQVHARVRDCRVVFITLGLVEVWYDEAAQVHLNTTPTEEMREHFPERYSFQVSNYVQNLENLERLHALLTKYGHPQLQMVVTTSPVPLNATFSGQDVVVANTYSKATLRAVAQDFAAAHENVQYFPSYEMVINSQRELAWEEDLRHVQGGMTAHVMDEFLRGFVEEPGLKAARVAAVTVNYNTGKLVKDLVESLVGQRDIAHAAVVDNASADGSADFLSKVHDPRVSLIRNPDNRGFSAACNQGAALGETQYLLFINPDCRLAPGALTRLVDVLDHHPNVAMAGPLILNADGSEQRGCRRFLPNPRRALMRVLHLHRPDRDGRVVGFDLTGTPLPDKPMLVEAISGACMLIRQEAFRQIGGWDEGYFLHCEDLDLCMRLKRAGQRVLFVPDALVSHAQGASSRRRPVFVLWHKHRGMWRYYSKFLKGNYPAWLTVLVWSGIWARAVALTPRAMLSYRR